MLLRPGASASHLRRTELSFTANKGRGSRLLDLFAETHCETLPIWLGLNVLVKASQTLPYRNATWLSG